MLCTSAIIKINRLIGDVMFDDLAHTPMPIGSTIFLVVRTVRERFCLHSGTGKMEM